MDTWKDPDTLYEWYHEQGLSLADIADKVGVAKQTVANNMEKLGVDRRSATQHQKQKPAYHGFTERGYEMCKSRQKHAKIHQLIAIAEGADPHNIFDEYDVHHKNEVPWDNRPENLELHTHGDHRALHEGHLDAEWKTKEWLEREYLENERSCEDIGNEVGVAHSTIHEKLIKHDIPRRNRWDHMTE